MAHLLFLLLTNGCGGLQPDYAPGQPVLIRDPVRFPDALGDFTVHGKTHNSQPLVWMNVPEDQECRFSGVGRWEPPRQTWLESIVKPQEIAAVRELGRP